MERTIKCVQINLHRNQAASASLCFKLSTLKNYIVLIQEPLVYKNKVKGLNNVGKIFQGKTEDSPRSCIITSNDINTWPLTQFCDRDNVAIMVTSQGQGTNSRVILTSSYMSHDQPAPPKILQDLVSHSESNNIPVIVGADANAHHEYWGSSDTNNRGEGLPTDY